MWSRCAWTVTPRQRLIKHLATIDDASRQAGDFWAHSYFWTAVNKRLAEVALDESQREALKAKIATRVARPTEEQMAKGKRQHDADLAFIAGKPEPA